MTLLTRLHPPQALLMTLVTPLALPRLSRRMLHLAAHRLTLPPNLLSVSLEWPTIIGTVFLRVSRSATFPLTFPKLLATTTIPFLRRRLTGIFLLTSTSCPTGALRYVWLGSWYFSWSGRAPPRQAAPPSHEPLAVASCDIGILWLLLVLPWHCRLEWLE